ncbi:MAG: CHAT domain-containing protein [Alphaproteobacteria bacterium]|nr:CHAT domain-containing protein [Alphaproteobacteria bacterium]
MQPSRFLIAILAWLALASQGAAAQSLDIDAILAELMAAAQQGRHAEALPRAREAVAVAERTLAGDDLRLAEALNFLALGELQAGDFAAAEDAGARALAVAERNAGADGAAVMAPLTTLSMIRERQQRWADAEALLERVLVIVERHHRPDDPIVADVLNNLAVMHLRRGRSLEARALLERALAIRDAGPAPAGYAVAATLNNLALLDLDLGHLDFAAERLTRATAVVEAIWGPSHPVLAEMLSNLGFIQFMRERPADSAAAYARALDILRDTVGADHPSHAAVAANLAMLRVEEGRIAEAEDLLRMSLATAARTHGDNHPMLVPPLSQLLRIHRDAGRDDEALAVARRISAIQRRNLPTVIGAREPRRRQTYDLAQANYLDHVELLARAIARGDRDRDGLMAEAFDVAQLARQGAAAQATAQMAARFAAGTEAFAHALRARQDLAGQWQRVDELLAFVRSRPAAERDPGFESRMLADRTAIEADLEAIDRDLAEQIPDFPALVTPATLTLPVVRASLRHDEAMLVYLVGERATSLFVVRADAAALVLVPGTMIELDETIRKLRAQLDLGSGRGLRRTTPVAAARPFDLEAAHGLGRRLLAPALPLLAGVRHLLVVPSGPLERLPFGVLATEPAPRPIVRDQDYRDVAWLAKRYAISILPAIGMRTVARPDAASRALPFIGFGDPVLAGGADPDASVVGQTAALVARNAPAGVDDVRRLPPLPESRTELRSIAAALGAASDAVLLGRDATETRVKTIDLSRYRVIAFATHGLLAGEFKGTAEPALVLTPPASAMPLDDGLLTASEIARLKLDADLVVLSACNTAAPDGVYDTAGLSGLARAFLFAGTRSLLVSHWTVASDAAAELTTRMFAELIRDPAIGAAEALRRSEMAMLHDDRHAHFAHPAFWSPFIVVGRGSGPAEIGR